MQGPEPQHAAEEHNGSDYVPTSPASSRGMDEDETVGALTRCVPFSSPGERPAEYTPTLTGGRDGVCSEKPRGPRGPNEVGTRHCPSSSNPSFGYANAEKRFLLQMARDIGAEDTAVVSEIYSPPRVTEAARRLNLGITPVSRST